jgi:photosystem II stability/assembly factor-like uncharacterized protein
MPVPTAAVGFVDVNVCRPEDCPGCDPQEDCVVAMVSVMPTTTGAPYLYINEFGGDIDQWAAPITLTDWAHTTHNPSAILCLGDLVVIVSNGAGGTIYSDDLGATLVEVTETSWATYGMNELDGLDHTFIVQVGDSGRIWASYDAARSWDLLDDGVAVTGQIAATDPNLYRVMIARDNPQVIYATGENGVIVKTANGGENWYQLASPCTGDGIHALHVRDQYHVIIGNDDGEVWETSDGGESGTSGWSQQIDLPSINAAPFVEDIVEGDCDGLFLILAHTGGTGHRVYRNVDGGASGRWYIPENVGTPTYRPRAVACCDINRAVIVGADTMAVGDTNGSIILLA